MKNSKHSTTANHPDLLVTVARSIGSTLGTVVAKVGGSTRRSSSRRARPAKKVSPSRATGKTSRKRVNPKGKKRAKAAK
jgi:hypothetical protein